MAQWRTILVVTLCVLLPPLWSLAADDPLKPENPDEYELHKLLVETIIQVEQNYVKPIDRRKLVEAAIQGVLRELDDYSGYVAPESMSGFRTAVSHQFAGIGIQVGMQRGQLTVVSPLVGSPAYRAGLMAGDRIVEIDGQTTKGLRVDDAVELLKGQSGTSVVLKVEHPGRVKTEDITLTREVIRLETVLGDLRGPDDRWDFLLEDDLRIGYVRITGFGRDTADDLRKVLTELAKERLAGLILDLRFNPGGLLSSAIQVSDLFVSEGRIVSTEGRNVKEQVWDARKSGTFDGFPMAILVNRYSASASEIVAACLQDHQRAVVIGERTYGKGSVQRVIEMEGGQSALKLTTAGYHRPNGKNIDRHPGDSPEDDWGVKPNDGFELRLNDAETVALARYRRERDTLKPPATQRADNDKPAAGGGSATEKEPGDETRAEDADLSDSDVESGEAAYVDLQLKMAVDYVREQLTKQLVEEPKDEQPSEVAELAKAPETPAEPAVDAHADEPAVP